MKSINILVIGADTCIGYALCKRFIIDRAFCVYGIYVEFSHYGNQSFTYARKQNMLEIEDLDKEECLQYLTSQTYDVIFWCMDILTKDNLSESRRKFEKYQQVLSSLQTQTMYIFKDKHCLYHEEERWNLNGKSIILTIPKVFGIFQSIEHIVPQIIFEQKYINDVDMEEELELISAWSLAKLLKEKKYNDIDKYTLRLKKADLIRILSLLKQNSSSNVDYCKQILNDNNVCLEDQYIYYMIEVIEFYISNKTYYEGGK